MYHQYTIYRQSFGSILVIHCIYTAIVSQTTQYVAQHTNNALYSLKLLLGLIEGYEEVLQQCGAQRDALRLDLHCTANTIHNASAQILDSSLWLSIHVYGKCTMYNYIYMLTVPTLLSHKPKKFVNSRQHTESWALTHTYTCIYIYMYNYILSLGVYTWLHACAYMNRRTMYVFMYMYLVPVRAQRWW